MIIKLKSFSALIAKLLQPLNFLTLSNDRNPAKPRHRPFEQSLFLFFGNPLCVRAPPPIFLERPVAATHRVSVCLVRASAITWNVEKKGRVVKNSA